MDFTFNRPITWTNDMNVILCREIDFINPYKNKERTKERGQTWAEIAGNLRKHGFDVTKRLVRDKYKSLKDSVKRRNRQEERASGIAPELTDKEAEVEACIKECPAERK